MKVYKKLLCCSVLSFLTIDVMATTKVDSSQHLNSTLNYTLKKPIDVQVATKNMNLEQSKLRIDNIQRPKSAANTQITSKFAKQLSAAFKDTLPQKDEQISIKSQFYPETYSGIGYEINDILQKYETHPEDLTKPEQILLQQKYDEYLRSKGISTTLNPGDKQYEVIALDSDKFTGVVAGLQKIANVFGVYDDLGTKTIDISLESLHYVALRKIEETGKEKIKKEEIKKELENIFNCKNSSDIVKMALETYKVFLIGNNEKIKEYLVEFAKSSTGAKLLKKIIMVNFLAQKGIKIADASSRSPKITFSFGNQSGSSYGIGGNIKITIGQEMTDSVSYKMSTTKDNDQNWDEMLKTNSINEILVHELSHAYRQILGITPFLALAPENEQTAAMKVSEPSMRNNSFNQKTMDPMFNKLEGSIYQSNAWRDRITHLRYDTPDEMLAILGKAVFTLGGNEYAIVDRQNEGALMARQNGTYRLYHGAEDVGEKEFMDFKNYVNGEKAEANTKQLKALEKKMHRENDERLYDEINEETSADVYESIYRSTNYKYVIPQYIDEDGNDVAKNSDKLSQSVQFLDYLKKGDIQNAENMLNLNKLGNARDIFWNNAIHELIELAKKNNKNSNTKAQIYRIIDSIISNTTISLNGSNAAGFSPMQDEEIRQIYLEKSKKIQQTLQSQDNNTKRLLVLWQLTDALYTSNDDQIKEKLEILKNHVNDTVTGYRGYEASKIGEIKLQDHFGIEVTVGELIDMYCSDESTQLMRGSDVLSLPKPLQKIFDILMRAVNENDASRVKVLLEANKLFIHKLLNYRQKLLFENYETLFERALNHANSLVQENSKVLEVILEVAQKNNINMSTKVDKALSNGYSNLSTLGVLLKYGGNPDLIPHDVLYTSTERYKYLGLNDSDKYVAANKFELISQYMPNLEGVDIKAKQELEELKRELQRLEAEKNKGYRSRWKRQYNFDILVTKQDIEQVTEAIQCIENYNADEAKKYENISSLIDQNKVEEVREALGTLRLSAKDKSELKNTILMKALEKSNEMFNVVLESNGYKVRPDWLIAKNSKGQNILMLALQKNNQEAINKILSHSAFNAHPEYIFEEDGQGKNALMYAAEAGEKEIARNMLEMAYNADPERIYDKDNGGKSAINYANEELKKIFVNFAIQHNLDLGKLLNGIESKESEKIKNFYSLIANSKDIDEALKQDPWLISASYNGKTVLMEAALSNNVSMLQKILQHQNVDPRIKYYNNTALKMAIIDDKINAVKVMLNSDIYSNNLKYIALDKVLKLAATNSDIEMFKTIAASKAYQNQKKQLQLECFEAITELFEKNDLKYQMIEEILNICPEIINSRDNNGITPIMIAACVDVKLVDIIIKKAKSLGVLESVINAKTPGDYKNRGIYSALSVATKVGKLDVVKLLKQTPGINLDIQYGEHGETELMAAASSGNLELVKYVESKLNNQQLSDELAKENDWDKTALLKAIRAQRVEVVRHFLELDHYKNAPQKLVKEKALEEAIESDNKQVFDLVFNHAFTKNSNAIDPNIVVSSRLWDQNSDFICHVLKQLKKENAINVNLTNKNQETPLILAAESSNTSAAKILLGIEKIDLNATNSQDETALMIASANGNLQLVDALLARTDIDVYKKSENNYTALDLARAYEHSYIEALLIANSSKLKQEGAKAIKGVYDNEKFTGTVEYVEDDTFFKKGDVLIKNHDKIVGFMNQLGSVIRIKGEKFDGKIVHKIDSTQLNVLTGTFELKNDKFVFANNSGIIQEGTFDDDLNIITGTVTYNEYNYTDHFNKGDVITYADGEISSISTSIQKSTKIETGTFNAKKEITSGTVEYTQDDGIYKKGDVITYADGEISSIQRSTKIETGTFNAKKEIISGTIEYTQDDGIYKKGDVITYADGEISSIQRSTKIETGTFNAKKEIISGTVEYTQDDGIYKKEDLVTYENGEIIEIKDLSKRLYLKKYKDYLFKGEVVKDVKIETGIFNAKKEIISGTVEYTQDDGIYKSGDVITYADGEITSIQRSTKIETGTFNAKQEIISGTVKYTQNDGIYKKGDLVTYAYGAQTTLVNESQKTERNLKKTLYGWEGSNSYDYETWYSSTASDEVLEQGVFDENLKFISGTKKIKYGGSIYEGQTHTIQYENAEPIKIINQDGSIDLQRDQEKKMININNTLLSYMYMKSQFELWHGKFVGHKFNWLTSFSGDFIVNSLDLYPVNISVQLFNGEQILNTTIKDGLVINYENGNPTKIKDSSLGTDLKITSGKWGSYTGLFEGEVEGKYNDNGNKIQEGKYNLKINFIDGIKEIELIK